VSLREFFYSGAHPEEQSDEGSNEILPRFARQDEGLKAGKTPQPLNNCIAFLFFFSIE